MSEFTVPIVTIKSIENHPDPEVTRLTIVLFEEMEYLCIANKHEDGSFRYTVGQKIIYIPEQAVVPEWLLKHLGFWDDNSNKGILSGSKKNMVKAKRLKGIFSQGLICPIDDVISSLLHENGVDADNYPDDVSSFLEIEKWEPAVPTNMRGETGSLFGYTKSYDFDNIKKNPNTIDDDEFVYLTEKIHGTFVELGFCSDLEPREDLFGDGRIFITSKGLAKNGFYIKNVEANNDNLYVKTLRDLGILDKFVEFCKKMMEESNKIDPGVELRYYIMGEIFGDVQDLKYGMKNGQKTFRMFDIYICHKQNGLWKSQYLDFAFLDDEEEDLEEEFGIQLVPVIAYGQWASIKPKLYEYTHGNSLLDNTQIREGVVIKLAKERTDKRGNRIVYKSVSESYLLRKGNNQTEYS